MTVHTPFSQEIRAREGVCTFQGMAWAEPQYSREQVNAAGNVLLQYETGAVSWLELEKYVGALSAINNWRASHSYPLNTFQMNLRHSSRKVDAAPLIAQRIKRLSSITLKLERFPKMKLSQMQDIGGCRAVVKSVGAVRQLVALYKKSGIKHKLTTLDDYIITPRDSGYRGVHLTYRYFSDKRAKEVYNGLKIEMQLRSLYQHAWATAVETVGTFLHQALKSSLGQQEWLRFFALMGSAVGMREKTPAVPNTPAKRAELVAELDHYAHMLNVENRLRTYGDALQTLEEPSARNAHYYLLELDPAASRVTITGFTYGQLDLASKKYAEAERAVRERPGTDAVLVSVESPSLLRRAYPNYFADTRVFVELMNQALSGHQRRIFTGPLKLPSQSA